MVAQKVHVSSERRPASESTDYRHVAYRGKVMDISTTQDISLKDLGMMENSDAIMVGSQQDLDLYSIDVVSI